MSLDDSLVNVGSTDSSDSGLLGLTGLTDNRFSPEALTTRIVTHDALCHNGLYPVGVDRYLGIVPLSQEGEKLAKYEKSIHEARKNGNRGLLETLHHLYNDYIEVLVQNNVLRIQNYQDELTGLWNQSAINQLETTIPKGKKNGLVLFGDANCFKLINDLYSYNLGDRVLQEIARSLNVRTTDFIARYGGDEFYIYALPSEDGKGMDALDASNMGDRIIQSIYDSVNAMLKSDDQYIEKSEGMENPIEVSFSLGGYLFTDDETPLSEGRLNAESMMKALKSTKDQNPQGQFALYDPVYIAQAAPPPQRQAA